jgi:uncharacterized protein YjbI with pentapeptide repeats
MANEEQLSILKQGVEVWNKWRYENPDVKIDLSEADLTRTNLSRGFGPDPYFSRADLFGANLRGADLKGARLEGANLRGADLSEADFSEAYLSEIDLSGARVSEAEFSFAWIGGAKFSSIDLSEAMGLDEVLYHDPSEITVSTFFLSKGKIPEAFLKGCGLSDWEIEVVKLYNPELRNEERSKILYKIYDLQASQAIQISPLFISYGHGDSDFVDKVGTELTQKGVRYWRDIHDMKSGRMEKQIDRAIRQNPTVLLILSNHSLSSDWVEHEVRTAQSLEKEMERDVLCPVALDDSWKSSRWPKRIMEQIMEYNILDFSGWRDDTKFDGMLRRLIEGLELFYKR